MTVARVVAAVGLVIAAGGLGGCQRPSTPSGDGYAQQLRSAISTDAVIGHLRRFQDIAQQHGGTRQTGTSGYSASLDYVVDVLEGKGFDVVTPEFEISVFRVDAESLSVDGTAVNARAVEYSGGTPAAGITGPLLSVESDGSPGCEATDYDGRAAVGAVVIVDRGSCYLSDKAAAAAQRGAAGLVIVNDVEEKAFSAALLESDRVAIPVISVSRADGIRLRTRTGSATVVVDADTRQVRAKSVVAQTKTGSQEDVVAIGAHLDSVRLGPGINDNASGVAAVLETASMLGSAPPIRNAVRFAFWGGEEEWMIGSNEYVKSLDVDALKDVALYLNFDMVGSPNPGYFTLDGNLSSSPDPEFANLPVGSADIEHTFADFLAESGISTRDLPVDGRGDYNAFVRAGVPVGQLFTGSESLMTPEEAQLWGGRAGEAFDPEYHSEGDDLGNVNRGALDITLPAIAYIAGLYAQDQQGIPIRTERERRLLLE